MLDFWPANCETLLPQFGQVLAQGYQQTSAFLREAGQLLSPWSRWVYGCHGPPPPPPNTIYLTHEPKQIQKPCMKHVDLYRSSGTYWSEDRSPVSLLIIIRVRWPWLIRASSFSALINRATRIKWSKVIRSSESGGSHGSEHQCPVALIDQNVRIQWPLLIRPPDASGFYWSCKPSESSGLYYSDHQSPMTLTDQSSSSFTADCQSPVALTCDLHC